MANQIDEDEPLDPVMEKVRVKMVRLLGISIGLMLLALITVLGAVVYKISQGSENAEVEIDNTVVSPLGVNSAPLLESIDLNLPANTIIVSANISNNQILLDLKINNSQRELWVMNLQTGEIISRVRLK